MSQDNEKPYNPASMPQYQSAIDARSFGALESKVENFRTGAAAIVGGLGGWLLTHFFNK